MKRTAKIGFAALAVAFAFLAGNALAHADTFC